jgi:hypothetical protein
VSAQSMILDQRATCCMLSVYTAASDTVAVQVEYVTQPQQVQYVQQPVQQQTVQYVQQPVQQQVCGVTCAIHVFGPTAYTSGLYSGNALSSLIQLRRRWST